ncbi:hypothetical protein KSB_82050 [Ktedonobacter robiniae]|uniref:Uncharacterized protein n=1 Tax=Ktedonobacter robiniae TaxID=2778365 RepID=A0ABQ3V4B3_9CHLR|nr:hypothetical protein KSB_82050 [Ktedonobacter robiniae]
MAANKEHFAFGISPITSAHINMHGSHHLDLQAPKSGTDNCAPYGQRPSCSKEATETLSIVDISHFWAR